MQCTSEVSFLLTGKVLVEVPKQKKYRFVKGCSSYCMVGHVLYMRGADLILRRIPWHEQILHILEANHEGVCGGHFAFKRMLRKILREGYVWPSLQRDVRHWCKTCLPCQQMSKRVLHPELRI